jgi:hypothetical protein
MTRRWPGLAHWCAISYNLEVEPGLQEIAHFKVSKMHGIVDALLNKSGMIVRN